IVKNIKALDLNPSVVGPSTVSPHDIKAADVYDCIIVDHGDVAQKLRSMDRFKYIPIVLVAPRISVSFKTALENGISSYMTTPCLPIDLDNALIPALEGRAAPTASDHTRTFDILLAEDKAAKSH